MSNWRLPPWPHDDGWDSEADNGRKCFDLAIEEMRKRHMGDPVNHPQHYTAHPSGVECIQITEHMGFCIGNAVKYLWRADLKGDAIQDLEKARWYIEREIARRKADTVKARAA